MSRSVSEPSKTEALRICIVDAHSVYRTGLRTFIAEKIPGAQVFEAGSFIQGLSEIRFVDPFDVVLIDLDLSSFHSFDLLKQAFEACPRTRFAIISASDTRESILVSLAVGFHGFISKHQFDDDILDAIRDVAAGRIYVPPSIAEVEPRPLAKIGHAGALIDLNRQAVAGAMPPAAANDVELLKLTPRQREVLSYLALGMSNKEIARALHIAEATAKVHAGALLRALGARNRTEAAFKAGKVIKSLERSSPQNPSPARTATVREDGRTLPLRLMRTKPIAQATGTRVRRKSSLD